jgi:lipopolysaccharide export system protein LptA
MDRQSDVSEAFGDVHATLESAPAAGAASKPQSATHVLAASARFEHDGKLATFRGTDAQPARLWQDASQVQAANLIFDGEHHSFSARPAIAGTLIHVVFAGAPAKAASGTASKPVNKPTTTNIVRVASPRMDYNDVQREATFSGGVQMDGTLGEVRSQRVLVYLTPLPPAGEKKAAVAAQLSPFNGSLDRVVVLGDVQLEQPGRHGSGEQLLYTAASGDYVLTGTAGHPPRVVDAQQGSVTGTTLTFGGQGSTIMVAGSPGTTTARHERVRTDTEVRQ